MNTTTARVDTAGIAQLLGCTREHVTNRLTKRPDFPAPIVNVSRKMRFWALADVQRWMRGKRPLERPVRRHAATEAREPRP